MKFLCSLIIALILGGNGMAQEDKTIWIGHPVVSDNHKYTPTQGWLPGYQIGLREDGVVVWREALPERWDGK